MPAIFVANRRFYYLDVRFLAGGSLLSEPRLEDYLVTDFGNDSGYRCLSCR
jgi:hypothetical protein